MMTCISTLRVLIILMILTKSKTGLVYYQRYFRAGLGRSKFVMHLDLATTDKLARVDKEEVLTKLQSQGYFVQLPPQDVMRRQAELRARESQDSIYN